MIPGGRPLTAAMVATALVSSGCGDPAPPPDPADTLLYQDGPEGLRWGRDVADVSVSDVESWFAADGFSIKAVRGSEHCSTASHSELGVTAYYDTYTTVHALEVGDGFVTPEGIRVGSPLVEIREVYGKAVILEEELADTMRVLVDDLDRLGQEVTAETMVYAFNLNSSGFVHTLSAGRVPWVLGCDYVTEWVPGEAVLDHTGR